MHNELDMLRRALADGSISKAELQARLTAIIEDAYQRLPVDAAFIADCETLLQTVITGDAAVSSSIALDCWKTIHLNTRTRESVSLGWKGRFALVAAACLIVFGLLELNFGHTWVGGISAYGGSTYIIGTHRMHGGLSAATAREWVEYDEEWKDLNTQSWEELVSFLGYEPPTVDVAAFGLPSNGSYYGNVSESSLYSSQSYSSYTSDGTLRSLYIDIHDYTAPDKMGFSFSQIRPGKYVRLSDGTKVYVSTQYRWTPQDREIILSVTWLDDLRIYHLIGSLTEDEMLAVAEKLCGQ